MNLIDRDPDFWRARHTRCAACGHEEAFDVEWFERWSRGSEACPHCGVDSSQERATTLVADPADPALKATDVSGLSWWHTTTHEDWPRSDFDLLETLDACTRLRMGEPALARWEDAQKKKALHVGTYEAAVHNMLRRITDQAGASKQFYLARVTLRPDVVVADECREEVPTLMGDVPLAEACPPGIDVTRYINLHEGPGGISLALGRGAIHRVQSLAVPLPVTSLPAWAEHAQATLADASPDLFALPESDDPLTRLRRQQGGPPQVTSRRIQAQQAMATEAIDGMPANLHGALTAMIQIDNEAEPSDWVERLVGFVQLITQPGVVIAAVRNAPDRRIAEG